MGVGVPACEGIITTHFSLLCREVIIPPVQPPKGGGGGPYPAGQGAWNQVDNIQDFYKPASKDIYDVENTYKVKKEVVIRVEFKNFHMEKTYLVPIHRAKVIIKAIGLANRTKERIKININKIKSVLHNIKVSVSNLRRNK